MTAGYKISQLPADFDRWQELLDLITSSFAYIDGIIDPPSSARSLTIAGLKAKASDELALVATAKGQLIGCAFVAEWQDRFYVGKLAVAPDRQRQGVAAALLEQIERLAVQVGKPTLELQVRIELVGNHAAFERLGFRKTVLTSHAGYARPTSITMRKHLQPGDYRSIQMADVHVVPSDSAGGSLSHALRRRDIIFSIPNDSVGESYDLGPLGDGPGRAEFFRDLWRSIGEDPELYPDRDAFEPWRQTREAIARMRPERVLVWASESGQEQTFLRMCAHFLTDLPLWEVPVPRRPDSFVGTGTWPADKLIGFLPNAFALYPDVLVEYRDEFASLARNTKPLRMTGVDGSFTFHELSFFDEAILGYCEVQWQRAPRIVALTMGFADPLNPPDSLFIQSRLFYLREQGLIDMEKNGTGLPEMNNYRVRLANR